MPRATRSLGAPGAGKLQERVGWARANTAEGHSSCVLGWRSRFRSIPTTGLAEDVFSNNLVTAYQGLWRARRSRHHAACGSRNRGSPSRALFGLRAGADSWVAPARAQPQRHPENDEQRPGFLGGTSERRRDIRPQLPREGGVASPGEDLGSLSVDIFPGDELGLAAHHALGALSDFGGPGLLGIWVAPLI